MSSRYSNNGKDYIKCPCDGLNEWFDIAKVPGNRFKCDKCGNSYAIPHKPDTLPKVEKPEVEVPEVESIASTPSE
jgi:hypothetical protein